MTSINDASSSSSSSSTLHPPIRKPNLFLFFVTKTILAFLMIQKPLPPTTITHSNEKVPNLPFASWTRQDQLLRASPREEVNNVFSTLICREQNSNKKKKKKKEPSFKIFKCYGSLH